MAMPYSGESWLWWLCTMIMIILRLISRKILFRSIRGLQIDDWAMGLFVAGCYTIFIVISNKYLKAGSNLESSGFDWNVLSPADISQRVQGSKYMIVVEQMQVTVIWSCKACLLLMYHKVTRTALRIENIAIRLLSVYVALGFIVMEILYFAAWCRPFSEYYAVPTTSKQCDSLTNHRIVKAVFNISSDLILLCIGLQMLIRSNLPLKRKLVLIAIFSLGTFAVTAAALSAYYSLSHPYVDTWLFWYMRESSTVIIVANMPFTWTILRELFEVGDFQGPDPQPWSIYFAGAGASRAHRRVSGSGGHSHRSGGHSHQSGPSRARAYERNRIHMTTSISIASVDTQSATLIGSVTVASGPKDSPTKSLRLSDSERDELPSLRPPSDDFPPVHFDNREVSLVQVQRHDFVPAAPLLLLARGNDAIPVPAANAQDADKIP